MIGYIKGKIIQISENSAIVDVSGVGYKVGIGRTFSVNTGDEIELFVHTSVRQDDISLWGFETLEKLEMFELLLSVSGVGLKTALLLVEEVGINKIVGAVQSSDPAKLKAPGVGKKTGQRIIVDLQNKLANFNESASVPSSTAENTILEDAKQALRQLGYKDSEIDRAVEKLEVSQFTTTETLLKELLKNI